MMSGNSIWDEIKFKIFQSGNTLYQLIFIIPSVFIGLRLLDVFYWLFTRQVTVVNTVNEYLAVPHDPIQVLTKPWTLITYMFQHADIWHILFNMLIFYWFGRIFQEYMGNKKLLSTFIVGGIAGALIFIIAYQVFPALSNTAVDANMVGASAGVMAVVVATATLLPDFKLNLLLLGPVSLKYIAMFMVVISLLGSAGANAGGQISHIGGALYGFIYMRQLQKGTDIGEWFTNLYDSIKSLFSGVRTKSNFKVHRNEERQKTHKTYPGEKDKKREQKEIDRILDKIAESGYDSLTKEERDKLFKASK